MPGRGDDMSSRRSFVTRETQKGLGDSIGADNGSHALSIAEKGWGWVAVRGKTTSELGGRKEENLFEDCRALSLRFCK